MRKTYLLSTAAAVVMLFASCEKHDQRDEIASLEQQLSEIQMDVDANTAAIKAMEARITTAIATLKATDAALSAAIAQGAELLAGGQAAIDALQAQFDEAYASALVLVNEALAASIAQDAELAQRIQDLQELIDAIELKEGPAGADGADGSDGSNGSDGSDGVDGVDGADAGSGSPDGLGEDGTTPNDEGSQTLGQFIAGYPAADYAKLANAGFTIMSGQTVFSFQPVAGVNHHYFLAPPTNGVYSWENASTDDVDGTIDEAIAAITNY